MKNPKSITRAARLLALLLLAAACPVRASGKPPHNAFDTKPNIIFILMDDLAMGDVACFGQKKIKTPNMDRMAREGIKFPQFYSGSSVCAPSRASLMTGLTIGHCPIRANCELPPEGQMPLPEEIPTVAQILKSAGYVQTS